MPMALVDLGASAGLNLVAERLPAVWTDPSGAVDTGGDRRAGRGARGPRRAAGRSRRPRERRPGCGHASGRAIADVSIASKLALRAFYRRAPRAGRAGAGSRRT